MTWNPLTEPIDWVDFAGQSTPGLAEIVGAGSPRRWDKRESVGFSGSYLVFFGNELSSFSVRVKLYTTDDWLGWYRFAPVVRKTPIGAIAHPVDITHPLLAECGIRSCVIEDVTQAEQVAPGEWQIEIKCIEYRSPRYALAAAKGSKANPDDPEEAIIKERREAFDALGEEIESAEQRNQSGGSSQG